MISCRHPIVQKISIYSACLLSGALGSVLLGQDRFSDLRNYHLYNPWAFLNGRNTRDILPADLQTFFNPLPDLPLYLLGTGPLAPYPRVFAAMQGLWSGVFLILLLTLLRRAEALRKERSTWAVFCAFILGGTGSASICQLGLSSNEVMLADLVLGSLILLLPSSSQTDHNGLGGCKARFVLAGLLTGLAAGLKPTAIIYVPPLALCAGGMVFFTTRDRCRFLNALVLTGAGCIAGFLITYGWWGVHLWRLTGNPVFPMFSQFFYSGVR